MNKTRVLTGALALISLTTMFGACGKKEDPIPVEQELITTLRLTVSDSMGISSVFDYRVENGFGNGGGTVEIDTLKLQPNQSYTMSVQVLNEQEDPVEDITQEVISESEDHLFLFISNPATGTGSVTTSNGSLDSLGRPFNQTVTVATGGAGSGTFTVYLMHDPTDKTGTTPATSGGETDVEAVFPVVIQ